MAFTQIIVTATYLKQNNLTPAEGEVTFMLTGTMRDTDTNVSISPQEVTATLDENGAIEVLLTATDGEFTAPRGVTYEVTERIEDSNENKFFITLPENSPNGTVDLADIAPNISTVISQTYATKQYVDSMVGSASTLEFTPTNEISSTTVQAAIEEVRAKSKYVHNQATASTVWNIQHNLKFFPNVTIVDSGENYVIGDVQYVDFNNLIVTFAHLFGGKAYLS
jgi:hypothetical protein